ncbi:NAD(P)-dependent oxidoreductase [Nonomuraea sp. LPB2021202275-12-8]|uniref:NAD(P)-dependent oxidoreductase n=1 Tax=Nonomuraea sp. LPB2021202275-12-8 TaxID=3120159 RepID=UPI00300D791C
MKILLFGATGMVGQRIAAELQSRGHEVTGVSRTKGPVKGHVADAATLARGYDVVISAIAPPRDGSEPEAPFLASTRALIDGVRDAGARRLITVGGAGSLQVAPGVDLVDTPDFPRAYHPESSAQRAALRLYRQVEDLDWTYFSPAVVIEPGERTGRYRLGGDEVFTDDEGRSRISAEDFAVAVADEVEKAEHPRRRVSVAY